MYYKTANNHDFFKINEAEKSLVFISSNPMQTRISVMKDQGFYNHVSSSISVGQMINSSEEAFNEKLSEIRLLLNNV